MRCTVILVISDLQHKDQRTEEHAQRAQPCLGLNKVYTCRINSQMHHLGVVVRVRQMNKSIKIMYKYAAQKHIIKFQSESHVYLYSKSPVPPTHQVSYRDSDF